MDLTKDIFSPDIEFDQLCTPVNLVNDTFHKNLEITRVYTLIVQDVRELLARMSYEQNRKFLLTNYEVTEKYSDNVLFEFTCVLCEIRLSVKQYCYYVELDTDTDLMKHIGGYPIRQMIRCAYKRTMKEHTDFQIEDCISINTNMEDHYSYFKNRLSFARDENSIVMTEEAVIE